MEVREKIDILSRLCQMGKELSSSIDIDELLAKISKCISEVCDSETASIILLDEEKKEMYFKKVAGDMGEIIKRIRIPLNEHSIAGWCIVNKQPLIVNDVSVDPRHFKQVDKKTQFITRSILAVPIIWGDKVFGVVEAVNKNLEKNFDEKDLEYLTILAHQAAVALKNVYLMEDLRNFFSYSVEILISALETLEPFAQGHIFRVARYATAMARKLNYSKDRLETVLYAVYFHDVGKLAQENIYVSRQEIEKTHPVKGAGLIENIKLLEASAPLVRCHHEKIDGSGYPEGLQGDKIPEDAQIIGIAVDYDEKWTSVSNSIDKDEFDEQFLQYARGKYADHIIEIFKEIIGKRK